MAAGPVEVPEGAKRPEGGGVRRRIRPVERRVDALLAEATEDFGDGDSAARVPLGTEVPLADLDSHPRRVRQNPLLEAGNELDRLGNPRLVDVGRIPERAGRADAKRGRRGVDSSVGATHALLLWIEVDVDEVDEAVPGQLLVPAHLSQPPREERDVPVRQSIGRHVEAHGGVLRREEILGPTPGRRARDESIRIRAAHGFAVGDGPREEFVVARRVGVDVAVCRIPEHRLVVENVDVDRARRRAPAAPLDLAYPGGDGLGRSGDARAGRVGRRERRALRGLSVARVGPEAIDALLRS